MKLLLLSVFGLAFGVFLAIQIRQDPGYVMVSFQGWTVEMSIVIFLAGVVLLAIALNWVWKLFWGTIQSPKSIKKWNTRRQERIANKSVTNALISQAQGEWGRAERTLVAQADNSINPMLNYIAAAKAAQAQGAENRRDEYLKLAQGHATATDIAVDVTQAELLMESGQLEQALESLIRLRRKSTRNDYVLLLLARVYMRLEDWEQLSMLVPELKRRRLLVGEEFEGLEKTMYLELMKTVETSLGLRNIWARIPRLLQIDHEVLLTFVAKATEKGISRITEPLLHEALTRQWNDDLAYLYGMVDSENSAKQLQNAEKWYKAHQDSPVLLLTLGRLSIKEKQLDKARKYLDESVVAGAGPESYRILAHLLEQMGDTEAAAKYYRKGLDASSETSEQAINREPLVIDAKLTAVSANLDLGATLHPESVSSTGINTGNAAADKPQPTPA